MSYYDEKWDCFRFAVKTGIKSLLCGHVLIGLKQLLFPISYWRFPVFNITLKNIKREKPIKILDIGSPKLLSLYLAIQCGNMVYATDLQDQEIFSRFYKHFLDHKQTKKSQYVVEYQDARALTYPDEFFDVVYSLSVLEHIPDDGDKEAAREIGRVLKKRGKAIIEIPFADSPRNEYMSKNIYDRQYIGKPIFYQRHYDEKTVFSRLVNESGLELEKTVLTMEKAAFEKYWMRVPKYFRIPFLWLEPFFSNLNHYFCNLEDWQRMKETRVSKKGMNITLVLRKN
jgi:SAM-dependent methyltransferase